MSCRYLSLVVVLLLAGSVSAGTISGQVLNEQGLPVSGVDLDFFVAATGDEDSANNDTTDANGNYSTTMDPQIYDVHYTPPPGSRLASHVERNVNLNENQLVDVTLLDAWFVTGRVTRSDTGLPAVGVDLDFEDLTTGEKLLTPSDSTDLTGVYSVAVPKGIYEVTFDGPVPELVGDPPQLAHAQLEEITIDGSGDISLPAITLAAGFHVTGSVVDNLAVPLTTADLDFLEAATGEQIFTKTDNTDADGDFDTIVPAGTYDIQIDPPFGPAVVAITIPGVVVGANLDLGVRMLPAGAQVTGFVRDPGMTGLRDVDLDLALSAGAAEIPTAWDNTNFAGQYLIHVTPGTYDFTYRPLRHSLVETDSVLAVGIAATTVLPDVILGYQDRDADGTADVFDNCPVVANLAQTDLDADGVGDRCDNCPGTANARQEDNDVDRVGDVCDSDDDNDGVADGLDGDRDGDGVLDASDNCAQAWNPGQDDDDADALGEACDPDDGQVEYLEARSATGFVFRPESGALGYQAYRQRLSWLSSINFGVCEYFATQGPAFFDEDLPGAGQGFAYLVTADMPGGEGSLGRRTDGGTRPNLRACP
jgi:hypothetical protein